MKKNVSRNVDITLILPCYNEREHFKKSVEYISRVLKLCRFSYKIIFIDDHSTDGTQTLIRDITKSSTNMQSIFHTSNQGRGACVAEGIRMSKSEIVGFMDIDCEVSPVYLPLFVDEILRGADLVVGRRYYPKELKMSSISRDITSALYSYLRKTLIPLPVEDTETGYKFFRKNKIVSILPKIKDSHWFWDTEIIARSTPRLTIREIPVLFLRRKDKTSTVHVLRDSIKYFIALHKYLLQK